MFRILVIAVTALVVSACANQSASTVQSLETSSRPASASPSNQLLEQMIGRWVLTGEIAGEATTHDVEAQWVLQGRYVRITEVSRERSEDGLPAYEATIFVGWLESADRYVCIWLDNTEVASGDVTCLAPTAENAIPFEFRNSAGALIFTNTFTYDPEADAWQWRMVNITEGREDVFGMVSLRRP